MDSYHVHVYKAEAITFWLKANTEEEAKEKAIDIVGSVSSHEYIDILHDYRCLDLNASILEHRGRTSRASTSLFSHVRRRE